MPDKQAHRRPPPDYVAEDYRRSREYFPEVLPKLKSGDKGLLERINTFADRYEFEYDEVVKKIRNDDMFRATFTKISSKTGFHEKLAAEWLSEEDLVHKFISLPVDAPDAWYVDGSRISKGTKPRNGTKALDFGWCTGKFRVWAAHKYTRGAGGSQNKQFDEMEKLLKVFAEVTEKNVVLIVIVDGNYYTEKKMNSLRELITPKLPKAFAVHIEDVPEILDSLPE